MCSVLPDSFATPWTVAHQAPLSMEFFRQEYWSGLPFPTQGDLPDPGIEPMSLTSPALASTFFTTCTTWEAPFIKFGKPKRSLCLGLIRDKQNKKLQLCSPDISILKFIT